MAHESFEDPAIAGVMNERFVCVKVDREERPDIDAIYMQATLAMTGHGGWPMTVFLTPDARPFYAGTYFPPAPRQGMPGFPDLCRSIADAYRDRPLDVDHTATELVRRLGEGSGSSGATGETPPGLTDDALVGLARRFDPDQGGFGGAPKFPPALALEFLLRRVWRRPNDTHSQEMAELTLLRMANGGIHDQVGGGFHRYSVDAVWLVPHFEKMLYDNALLASVYALAWKVTGRERYQEVVQRTLDYLLREMRTPEGGFAAAQDADSPGGEGAFFVWTPGEIDELLSPEEAALARALWNVTREGNFEHATTILHIDTPMERIETDHGPNVGRLIDSARAKLYAARLERPAPARDDKVLTAWNGLAIAAFAQAGRLFARADYLAAANEAADLLLDRLVVEGRLMRTYSEGVAAHLGTLDDYASLCHGLLALYDATFEPARLVAARRLTDEMVDRFADPVGGGFFFTGSDAPTLIARTRELEDHPTPAGNSLAARVLLTVAALTGDAALTEIADGALAIVRSDAARHPQAFGTALVAIDLLVQPGRQIVIVGDPAAPETKALLDAARRGAGPNDVIAAGRPDDDAAATNACPLLADRPLVDGRPAAYVCDHFTCAAPVSSPTALAALL